MSKRHIATFLLLISVCVFPIYITLAGAALCIVFFPQYYELIGLFFIYDVLFGAPRVSFFGFPYVLTLAAILVVPCAGLVRKYIFTRVS